MVDTGIGAKFSSMSCKFEILVNSVQLENPKSLLVLPFSLS